MRRNWFGRLFFALALAIQVMSPAAANFTRTDSAKTAFQICLKTAADFAAGDRHSPGVPDRHGGCLFCQMSCDGSAPLGALVVEIGVAPVQWRPSAWTVADRASPTPRSETSHQPRAPPVIS
ncbi:MAG: hypothetical protein WB816_07880 [Methylocystis sp.]